MKNNELRGVRGVFRFTLVQTLKSKAFIITMTLMLIASALVAPIMKMIQSNSEEEKAQEVDSVFYDNDEKSGLSEVTLHIYDETAELFGGISFTDLGFSWDSVTEKAGDCKVTTVVESGTLDDGLDALEQAEQPELVVDLGIDISSMGLSVTVYRGSNGTVSEIIGTQLSDYYAESLKDFKNTVTALTDAQKKVLDADITVTMNYTDETGAVTAEKDMTISEKQYTIAYVVLTVVLMVVILASTQVATSIATDKSTKVVEYLLTSVRPMALVVGKVAAMLTVSVGELLLMVVLILGGNKICGGASGGVLEQYLGNDIWKNVTFPHLLVTFVIIVLGIIMYGMFAALCGASVSKMEALQEALSTFTIVAIVGFYLAAAGMSVLLASGENAFIKFVELFPISSAFFMPGAAMIGEASVGMTLGSIAILLAADIFLFLFVARVYEMMINHNGERIKPKEWLTFYRTSKKGGKLV